MFRVLGAADGGHFGGSELASRVKPGNDETACSSHERSDMRESVKD
jgi:hypothetical protein